MHLIDAMPAHGIGLLQSGGTRINHTSILSKEINRFSLVYSWSALKS